MKRNQATKRKVPTPAVAPVKAPTQMRAKNARMRKIQDAFKAKYGDRNVQTTPIHVRAVGRVPVERAEGDPAPAEGTAPRERLKIRGCLITSKPVERWGWDSRRGEFMFMEILPAVEGKINLERAKKGIPILKNHDQYDLLSRIGIWTNPEFVAAAKSESGFDEIWFDGFISIDDDTRIICGRIEDGSMLDLSVGYWVPDYDDAGQDTDEEDIPTLVARNAEVLEGSLVTVPADLHSSAEVRIHGGKKMAGRRIQKGDGARAKNPQAPKVKGNAGARSDAGLADEVSAADDEDGGEDGDDDADGEDDEDEADGDDQVDPDADGEDEVDGEDADGERSAPVTATRAQAKRNKAIDTLCRYITNGPVSAKKLARQFHNTSATDAEIIAKNHEGRAKRSDARSDAGRSGMGGGSPQSRSLEVVTPLDMLPNGQPSKIRGRSAMIRAVVALSRGKAPEADAAQFAGLTTAKMFGDLFRAYGRSYNPHLNPFDQLVSARAVAPVLWEEGKALIGDIFTNQIIVPTDAVPAFIGEGWTRRVGSTTFLRQGGWMGSTYEPLVKHLRGGEIPLRRKKSFVAFYKLETNVGRYSIERTDFEDSALSFLSDLAVAAATASRRAHNGMMIDTLRENPEMLDMLPFHHVRRGNVGQNMPLTVSNVIKAQMALAGDDLTIDAPILLYGKDLYEEALRVSTPLTVVDPANINPVAGKIRPYMVPGMPATAWEVLVNPGTRPAYIDLFKTDRPNHVTSVHESAQFDGFEMKVTDDKGAAVCDPRGSFRAYTGAAPEELDSFNGEDTFEVDYGFED